MGKSLDEIIDRRTREMADLISLRSQLDIEIEQKYGELIHFVKKRDDDNFEVMGGDMSG
jgi:hypothetical protein